MEPIMKSEVFFFISSIGFVIVGILISIFLIYLIRISHIFSRMVRKFEKNIDSITDTTKEIIEDIQESSFFRMFVGKRKKRKSSDTIKE